MEIKEANTKNLVQEAMSLKPAVSAPNQSKLKDLIQMPQIKEMFRNALQENADSFLASVIDLYNNDRTLQACAPNEVIMECFKAATLHLPINKQLGFAWIVPYKDKTGKMIPTFQLGYRGLIQLCLRTGAYRHIHAGPVYEGEFVSENRLTGEIDLSGLKSSDKVIGFSAYIETVNGFSKAIYWTVDEINRHAKKYSKSFGRDSSPWVTDYESMATKTLLRSLLSKWGIMSVELQTALVSEIGQAVDEQLIKSDVPSTETMEMQEAG
jgi:recombination protein RecT